MKKDQTTMSDILKAQTVLQSAVNATFSDTISGLQTYNDNSDTIALLKDSNNNLIDYFNNEFYKNLKELKEGGASNKLALTTIFNTLKNSYTTTDKDHAGKILEVFEWYYLKSKKAIDRDYITFKNLKLLKSLDGYCSAGYINGLLGCDEKTFTDGIGLVVDYKKTIQVLVQSSEVVRDSMKEYCTVNGKKVSFEVLSIGNENKIKEFIQAMK